jgi:hypothetical protein
MTFKTAFRLSAKTRTALLTISFLSILVDIYYKLLQARYRVFNYHHDI